MSNYIDDYQPTAEDINPLACAAAVEFPFEQVFADLDGEEAKPDYPPALQNGIRTVLAWLVATKLDGPGAIEHLGKRTLALASAIDPDLLAAAPLLLERGRRLVCKSPNLQRLSPLASQHLRSPDERERQQAQGIAAKTMAKESLFQSSSMAVAIPSTPLARHEKKALLHATLEKTKPSPQEAI